MISAGPYDAILVLSFGGPEAPEDVMPFLENVTRGRHIPPERLAEVAGHYARFGGVSPINAATRDLIAALTNEIAVRGPRLPIYWGNRNWHPLLRDTIARMADDGRRRAVCFVTSAYGGYSSCRQYLDDIARARAEVGSAAPVVDKLRPFFDHPGFIDPFVRATRAALASLDPEARAGAHLVFSAHSVPLAQAAVTDYAAEVAEASRLVADRVGGRRRWAVAWQSRSGPPSQPGSNRRSGTISPPSRPKAWVRSWWSRSGSSPTTWRWCTTSTSRRPDRPEASGSNWSGRPLRARRPTSSP